jgi:hypothetical protein
MRETGTKGGDIKIASSIPRRSRAGFITIAVPAYLASPEVSGLARDLPPALVHVRIRQVPSTPSRLEPGMREREGQGMAF